MLAMVTAARVAVVGVVRSGGGGGSPFPTLSHTHTRVIG